jgi:hypothetical protein
MRKNRFCVVVLALLAAAWAFRVGSAEEASWRHQYKLDWLRWAEVKSVPYLGDDEVSSLCDNKLWTGARGAMGPEIGSTIEWRFPEETNVTEVRLTQQGADALEVSATLTADGKFDVPIATVEVKEKEAQGEQWLVIPVGKAVRGLRLLALDGQPPYRACYPHYGEIEIYTDKKVNVPPSKPEAPQDKLTMGQELPLPKFEKREIELTPCIDLWMSGHMLYTEKFDGFAESPGFQRLLQQLRDIDAAGVRIFLEGACCSNKMPWKSQICPNTGNEALKTLIDALHAQGLKSAIFLHAWIVPIQKEGEMAPMPYCRWDYPYEQSDFIFTKGLEDKYKVRYPCVISENDFRDRWTGIMSEVVDRGIDGVYVLPDEYYYKGHYLPKTSCPNCQKRFKERYGYDELPRKAADTAHYRKWKTFEYERLAEMFNEVAGELKKKKPGLELYCSPNLYAPSNTRMEHGVALDRMGAQANFTGVQVYCGDPKRAEGAFPDKVRMGSIQTLGTGEAGTFPIVFYDYFMDLLMNGCTKLNMYRLNYMEPYWKVVIKASKMARLLETWGLKESRTAAETCVLISRASEDWWQVTADSEVIDYINTQDSNLLYMDVKDLAVVWSKTRKTFKPDARVRKCQYERFRGMYSTQYVENLLKRNGVQYDIRYSERPETLDVLSRYKLVILPFSYSMSKPAFTAVEKAVAAGSKLLIYGQLAPTDEYGEKYPEPLLKALVGKPNVTHVETDLMWDWASRSARQANLDLVRKLLDSGHYFNPNGANVRYWARKVADGDYILYLGNLERERSAEPVLGLPLPAGNYAMTVCIPEKCDCDPAGIATYEGRIGNRPAIPADNLKRFTIALGPGEVKLLRVQRQGT